MTTTAKLTATQAAAIIGTDPKTLRRFLRTEAKGVGQGTRYAFTKAQVTAMAKRFVAWQAKLEADKAARVEAKPAKAPKAEPKPAKAKADTKAASEVRIDALEGALKARGTHISQQG